MIIDASVAAKWFLTDDALTEHAALVRIALVRRQVGLAAPSVIWPEIAHSIVRAVRRKRLDPGAAEAISGDIGDVRPLIRTTEVDPFTAIRTALVTGLSAYDAQYLRLGAQLYLKVLTADERMVQRGRAHGYDVVWLGDVTLRDGVLVDTPQGYE